MTTGGAVETWPFVGRRTEREWVLTTLRRRTVVIAGPAGVGKSRLAAEVAAAYRAPMRIRGTQAAGTLPLGAFAPLLPDGDPGPHPLRWATGAILAREPSLLVVDDAHLLDASSAALTHQLADNVRVLATVRSGEDCPDSVAALWEDDRGSRFDLEPLTAQETEVLLTGALGGPVDADTADRLHTLSQGNALLLRELVVAALDGSALVRARAGGWRLEGEVPHAPRLIEVIERRMGRFGAAVTSVLELVALAEPLGLAPLTALTSAAAVEEAEARGLIQVASDGRRTEVRLAHPLYGEAVRARLPVTRLRRRYQELAETVGGTGARRREDVLRIAVWRLESGLGAAPGPLVRACRAAWAAHDYPLALRLARAAVSAGTADATWADPDRVDGAIMLGTILNYSGQSAEAEALVAQVPPLGHDERQRTELALTRSWSLGLGLGRIEEALDLLTRTRAEITQRALRQDLTTLMLMLMPFRSTPGQILVEAEALLAEPPVTAAVRAQALNCRALTLSMIGRYDEALAAIQAAVDDYPHWRDAVPVVVLPLHGNWAMIAMMLGDLDGMRAAMDSLEGLVGPGRGSAYTAQSLLLHRAVAARLDGRLGLARQLLDGVRQQPGDQALTGICHIEHANVLAMSGDAQGARESFDLGVAKSTRLTGLQDSWRYLTEPWVIAAAGEVRNAADYALGTAEFSRTLGAIAFETSALQTVVRLGFAERAADRLAALVAEQDGKFAGLLAAHARAAADQDGAELERITTEYERLGFLPYAAECSAQAAAAWERGGRPAAARAARSRAWLLASRCEDLRTPALAGLSAPGLTRREEEIARLACAGQSTKEIAERLVLSHRTVENHLHNVYAKLGVTNRAELKRVLSP